MEGTAEFRRCIICPKCSTTCLLCTSRSAKNPGRQYYKCPSDNEFIKWADQVREKEWLDVPICTCKAGVCRVTKVMFGPNAGRMLFTCLIKEGHGSCGYRAWKDELEASTAAENDQSSLKSTLTNSDRGTDPNHADVVCSKSFPIEQRLQSDDDADDDLAFIYADEIIQSLSLSASFDFDHGISLTDVNLAEAHEGVDNGDKNNSSDDLDLKISDSIGESIHIKEMPTYELLETDISDNLQCVPVTYAKIERLRSHEKEDHSKSLKRPRKRSRNAYLEAERTLASWHSFKISVEVKTLSAKDYCWMTAAISQNLSPQLRGWLGRLVFRPSPCLIASFDAKFTQDLVDDDFEALMTVSRGTISCESGPQSIESSAPPGLLPSGETGIITTSSDDKVRDNSISKLLFAQAAEILQNDLIALLEATDARDHVSMIRASEAAFAALDCMFFDHRGLKARVNDLIRRAKSLAEIEAGEEQESSHERLIDCCSSKRMRLERFENVRAKTVEAMDKNWNRLRELKRQLASAKDWVFQMEAELAFFDAEMEKFEDGLEEARKGAEVLERDYMESCREVEESKKMIERREAVRNEARDAFHRARMFLRG